MPHESGLRDRYGRRVATLRISLTDHCNFRCVYCMPPEGLPHVDGHRYLSAAEVERFVRLAARMGVARVKLTGGEPLIRPDIVDIARVIRSIDGIDELSLTTNAVRLPELAAPLRDAGLDRVNISLDSLDSERFAEITRVDQLDRVWAGIDAAIQVGFPVKINVVVLHDMTKAEIVRFAETAAEYDIDVRFLEFMPLCGSAWEGSRVYPIAEVRDAVRERFDLIETTRGDRPAQTFDIAGGRGRVGFIASLTLAYAADGGRKDPAVPILELRDRRRNGTSERERRGCARRHEPRRVEQTVGKRVHDGSVSRRRRTQPKPRIGPADTQHRRMTT
jgi:cyclic pyranopterin phosphate synthase